jgi:phosphoglycolate phosphatase
VPGSIVPRVPYRAVLFDLDGTIMDSRSGIVAGISRALAAVGVDVEDDYDWTPYLGPPLRDAFARQHGLSSHAIDIAVAAYLDFYEGGGMYDNAVYPGMDDLLGRLTPLDVPIAVATSKRAFLADDILRHFGLRDRFDHVGGSLPDGTGGRKDDVIVRTLEALGVAAGTDVVMIGDRHHDIDGAKVVGLATIGVGWGYGEPGELEAAGADVVVATVDELAATLAPFRQSDSAPIRG